MATLGLHFCARAFSSCGKWGPLFIAVRGPLLLRSTGSRRAGSVIVAHGPSCSAACGILPDQGSNPCPLHWQADSQPLRHQGSPGLCFLKCVCVYYPHQLRTSKLDSLRVVRPRNLRFSKLKWFLCTLKFENNCHSQ